jgi:uncharacterized protein (DUF2236 family)
MTIRSAPRPDPVLGFYGPESMMWRINREAVLLGAGPAALLLQIAHPLVAEGVAQHSDYRGDPFGRLRRTLTTTMDLVFGDGPTAERAVRRLNGVHATVRGDVTTPEATTATSATAYRALDPELLLWVQATLIVTSVAGYKRWVGPIGDDERERFWQEARSVGTRIGIPLDRSPEDWGALKGYWERMLADDGPIQVTPTAQALAPMIVRPPLPHVPAVALNTLVLPGLGLLPPRIREAFGVDWSPRRQRLSELLGKGVHAWTSVVPASLRSMPEARAAFARSSAFARSNSVAPVSAALQGGAEPTP